VHKNEMNKALAILRDKVQHFIKAREIIGSWPWRKPIFLKMFWIK
jgi:hypothetical protein